MCKIKYVHRRKNSGKFQFRQNVPADLQEVLGKKVIKRSLDTMDRLTVGIMALVAQQEREMISQRTKAALAAAKARGQKLGCPNGAKHLRKFGNELGVKAIKSNADARAESLRATVQDLQRGGVMSLAGIAQELNSQQIKTARGGKWHPSSVKRLFARLG